VLADPAARSLVLETGAGRLFVASDGSAVLVLDALDPAPAGRTYQAWVVAGAEPVSAGVFATDDAGPLLVPLDEPVPDGAVVAVTIEREGGAEAPTSAPIAASPPV
jgi:anti-sigma-K factor RskA